MDYYCVLRRREFYNRIVIITTTTLYQHRSRKSYCVQYSTNPIDPTTPLRPQLRPTLHWPGRKSYAAAQSKNVLGDALAGKFIHDGQGRRTTEQKMTKVKQKAPRDVHKKFYKPTFIRKTWSFGIICSPRTRICNVSGC